MKNGTGTLATHSFLIGTSFLVAASISVFADASVTSVSLRQGGTNSDGDTEFVLQWNARSNRLYRIQQRGGFESNTTWSTIDVATPAGVLGKFKLTPDKAEAGSESIKRSFFRVEVPSPEIFSIEPAVLNTNGGTIYIRGQELDTNGVLRIGDVPMPVVVIEPGFLYSVTVPPFSEGTYDAEWITNGVVVAVQQKLFSVTGQPTPVGEASNEQRLLEPPSEPPASPITSAIIAPAALKVKEKGNRTKCTSNLRVIPPTGELVLTEEDLHVPGRGLDFSWVRTYRSRTGGNGAMGQGWSHCYDIRCSVGSNSVRVWDGTGRSDTYFLGTNGIYTANELFNFGTLSSGVFTLEFPDTGKWVFNSISNAVAPGFVWQCVDRNGNALRFGYNPTGRLVEVVDTLDRTNRITYNGVGKIESVTDHSGRTVTYVYWTTSADGGIRSVTSPPVVGTPNGNDFPAGKTTQYFYSQGFADSRLNNNLTRIIDANGQPWLEVTYAATIDPNDVNFDRVSVSTCGANPPSVFTYLPQTPAPSNHFAVMKTICNNPVGNVTVQFFDSLNRCIVHRDIAARATPGVPINDSNLPTAKLRDSDPDYWETRFEWNLDSLCTRILHPRGNSTEMVYQRSMDHNSSRSNKTRKHDGDVRVLREIACCATGDLDGDGLPLTLTTYFTYDPRFGSCPTPMDAMVPEISHVAIKTKGTGADKNRVLPTVNKKHAINTKGAGANAGKMANIKNNPLYEDGTLSGESALYSEPHFVTKMTDSGGNTDTFEYDAQGNCVRIAHSGYLLDASDKPVSNFEFNSHGQITAIVDPADANGYRRRTEFDYFSSGPQTGYLRTFVVDAQGPTVSVTTYDCDSRGNVTMEVDPRGNTNRWIYNVLDVAVFGFEPQQCAACSEKRTAYFYDANDNLIRVDVDSFDHTGAIDPVKPTWTTLYQYDELDRCTLVAHELTHVVQQGKPSSRYTTNRFVYDAVGNIVEHHMPEAVNGNQPGNYIRYQFDTRNYLWQQVEGPFTPQQSTDVYDYEPNGKVARRHQGAEDPTPATYSFLYDGFDRQIFATDAMGNTSTCAYDRNGNLVYERLDGQTNDVSGSAGNQRLSEVRYQYDSLNRLTHRTESFFDIFTELPLLDGGSTTSFSYAQNGACRSTSDDLGNTTQYSYDTLGRCVSSTDPKGNMVICTYDLNGNVITRMQNDRADVGGTVQTFTMTYQYDALNRCVVDYDNVGNTNLYAYDSLNNLVRHTDPLGAETAMTYTGTGLRIRSDCCEAGAGYNNRTIRTDYDDDSRPISNTDGISNVTHYTYDPLNRCVSVMRGDGTVLSLVWSPRSNIALRTDPNGTVTHYTYDALDRCVRKDMTPGGGVSSSTTFEVFSYDGASHLMSASNNSSSVAFDYNSLGGRRHRTRDGAISTADYDARGVRTSLTYPSGRIVQYSYDSLCRVTNAVTSAGGGLPSVPLASFAYEGPRLSRIAQGNGINTRFFYDGDVKAPNAAGDFGWQQVRQINHQRAGGGAVVDNRSLTYDRGQNKLSRTQLSPFVQGQSSTTNVWTYDILSQMRLAIKTKGTSAQIDEYELDANGNRLSTTLDGLHGTYTMNATTPEPADFQMNQYTTTPFGTRIYDHNGNLVSIPGPTGSTDFSYDYANRLVSVSRNVGPATIPVVSYVYDALGNRISKTTYPPAPSLPVTTAYYYDDEDCDGTDEIIEESENGTLRKTIVFPHALEVSGRIHMIAGAGTYYTQCDDLGNALALTDASGNVIERYDYDDFGQPHFLTSDGVEMTDSGGRPVTASPAGNRYLFCGMEWESETGLYFGHSQGGTTGPACKDYATDPYVETTQRSFDPKSGRYYQSPQTEKRNAFSENNPWTSSAKLGVKQKAWLCSNFKFNGRMSVGGHGGGGGGGCGGIAIDEQGVHIAGVYFNPKEYTISAREAGSGMATGRRSCAYAMYSVQKGCRIGDDCDDNDPLAYEQSVITAREAGSGMATGRRSYSAGHFELGVRCAREASSGMATGRRSYSAGHFALGIDGVRTAREASSGMATGRRSYNYFEAWPCRWKAPALNAMSSSGKKEFKGHVTLLK